MIPDPEEIRQAMRRAMKRAKDQKLTIVCEAFRVEHPETGALVGVCALTALERVDGDAWFRIGLTAKRGVIRGFDGLPADPDLRPLARAWFEVGVRLRDEFQPVSAIELERELEST